MWPTLFRIGDFEIGTFGLMVAIGFIVAYWVAIRRAAAAGLSEDRFANLALVSLFAGIVGAKALFVLVYWGQDTFSNLLFSRSGLVYYGGLAAGVAAGWGMTKRNGWDPALVADVIAPVIPLGQFFGRIGCFLNGCCYGKVCSNWMGVEFPKIEREGQLIGSQVYYEQHLRGLIEPGRSHSLPVYPTQLFEAGACLLTFFLLHSYLSPRTKFKGQLALVYLLVYAAVRFAIEGFRDDPRTPWQGGLSTSQIISIGVALFALALWRPLSKRAGARVEKGEEG
jgi:phosphatidylglycerol:prolipoprotein diacylglycerol transferase